MLIEEWGTSDLHLAMTCPLLTTPLLHFSAESALLLDYTPNDDVQVHSFRLNLLRGLKEYKMYVKCVWLEKRRRCCVGRTKTINLGETCDAEHKCCWDQWWLARVAMVTSIRMPAWLLSTTRESVSATALDDNRQPYRLCAHLAAFLEFVVVAQTQAKAVTSKFNQKCTSTLSIVWSIAIAIAIEVIKLVRLKYHIDVHLFSSLLIKPKICTLNWWSSN